jgi:membrane-associated protein
MHSDVAVNLLDAQSLIAAFGTVGIAVILFVETGLLVGLFLPGDSLLFTAGVLCATHRSSAIHLHLAAVLPAAAAGALLGAELGYLIGRRAGPPLLDGKDRPRLDRAVAASRDLTERYGFAKAIVLARFIPVVRTVANPVAGVIGVPARVFLVWQVVGGLLWSVGVTLGGFALGSRVHNVDHYLLPIVALIVVISLTPLGVELVRTRRSSRQPSPTS